MVAAADMPLASPAIMFYAVDPREHIWEEIAAVPPYVSQAIPWFFIFGAIELALSAVQGHCARRFNFKETAASLSFGIFSQVAGIPFQAMGLAIYIQAYEYAPWHVPHDSAFCWLALFLGYDLMYYALHRFCHEFHIGWVGHAVHHSGEAYNLATALRQGVLQGFFSPFFSLPLALAGLPPPMMLTHKMLNVLYQYWIHSESIGSLGPLEYVLNTPSHHRVHHRPGGEANYAGVLIIWDRMFGTFRDEGSKQVDRYGWGKPLDSFDPMRANITHALRVFPILGLSLLWRRRLVAKWRFSVAALFEPLAPGRQALWTSPNIPERLRYIGSTPPVGSWRGPLEAAYLSVHLLVTLVMYVAFEGKLKAAGAWADPCVWAMALWVLLSLVSLGRLADGDASGKVCESARLLALLPAIPMMLAEEHRAAAAGGAVALCTVWAAAGRGWWISPPFEREPPGASRRVTTRSRSATREKTPRP